LYTAVFFDLDDTLADETGASRRAVTRVCRELSGRILTIPADRLEAAYLAASAALWTADPERLAAPVRLFRLEGWANALAEIGADRFLAPEAVELYAAARRATYLLFPESLPLLRLLRTHCHVGIITNGPADLQREKVTMMGLEHEVDTLLIAGEVGISKPDPAIFHRALARAGCLPAEALMVGDSWEKDIRAARAVGMDALWVTPTAVKEAQAVSHIRDAAGWLAPRMP